MNTNQPIDKIYTQQEKDEIYNKFNVLKNIINNNISLILYKAREQQTLKEKYLDIIEIDEGLNKELKLVKQAILVLKSWYNKSKDRAINRLQERINEVLGEFFKNEYDLKLVQSVERGNNSVNLVAVGKDGKNKGTIEIMLSGAEQQLSGFLIQTAATSGENSSLMVLDEAFSSFGVEEVTMLPEIIDSLDMQIIIIEHKSELFEDYPIPTIILERDEVKGTYIRETLNMR